MPDDTGRPCCVGHAVKQAQTKLAEIAMHHELSLATGDDEMRRSAHEDASDVIRLMGHINSMLAGEAVTARQARAAADRLMGGA